MGFFSRIKKLWGAEAEPLATPQPGQTEAAAPEAPEDPGVAAGAPEPPQPEAESADADEPVVTERKRPRFAYRPQLLVVDGGAPQVAAAARALEDSGHTEIALCGIAKRLEEIWLPGEEYPVILPRTSEALYLLQRLRDEAHRFANGAHAKRRSMDITKNPLDEIEGVGPSRKKALLHAFGSAKGVSRASVADLIKVPGVNQSLAERIHGFFHKN